MKRSRVIPSDTIRDQARASDPASSAWVSANAGSGKTHVLAQRVIRLLLDDAEPSRILCLTYTKAAASNMSNRVFGQLAEWTSMPDEKLVEAIAAIDGRKPTGERLARARRLFARALETPGGLKIQTIHAFCEAVLHRFPLEANIAGHFEMLDSQMETALIGEARRDMLTGLAGGDEEVAAAFERVLRTGGEFGLDNLLAEILAKRDQLRGFVDAVGPAPFDPLYEEFDFSAGDRTADLAGTIWPDAYFDAAFAEGLRDRGLAAGKTRTTEFAEALLDACAETDGDLQVAKLKEAFLAPPRSTKPLAPKNFSNLIAKGIAAQLPEMEGEFGRFTGQLIDVADRHALLSMLHSTRAALTLADRLIERYERLKAARGFLDFNDLINRTVRLLARSDAGPWVQYKLDQGVDHILVDEAQDTSPDQWQVVRHLAGDFFSDVGARSNLTRTIFAVGDEKQSIYSFQGADPESFGFSGREFLHQVRTAGGSFEEVRLQRSFRSTPDVLKAVDKVFETPERRKGLSREDVEHTTVRDAEPGHVDVWPLLEPTESDEQDDWTLPVSIATAPPVVLAEQIGDTLKRWLDAGEPIEGKRDSSGIARRMRPGDVLVLVRKRDRFVHALTRALKNRDIDVAGADRLSLPSHIAVQDLIAIGRVALQPSDDLSLAALLKSPVFGLDEEMLFALAHRRGRSTLLQALRRHAEHVPALAAIVAQLDAWTNEAAFRTPFAFYAAVLGRDGVRSKLIARLGPSTAEILDEFLNFCLAVERVGLPGLETFLATLQSAPPDIKREMDQTRDEVRIMTVHAAKGLEAPVVFLVDGGSKPFADAHLPRLIPVVSKHDKWHGPGVLWRASAEIANSVSRGINAELAAKAEDEYRRLLYVGLTRAEDRLIVCGYQGKLRPDPGIWHRMVSEALEGEAQPLSHPSAPGVTIARYRRSPSTFVFTAAQEPATRKGPVTLAPLAPLPPEPELPAALSPSGAAALIAEVSVPVRSPRSPVFDPVEEPSFAIARGLAIHRLLQMLPGLPPAAREAAARRYLAGIGAGWADGEREQAWTSVAAVLDDVRFRPVFAEGSRAEVSIAGHAVAGGRRYPVSGKIDRLAVTPERVLIVDYKTNRPPPASLDEVPDAYVVQLALYRAMLAELYPGRGVAAALLFTETPALLELPAATMEAALERLRSA